MQGKELVRSLIDNIPAVPGVYLMMNLSKRIIYIGKAKNLKNRISNYSAELSIKNNLMIKEVAFIEYRVTDTEVNALLLESQLIKQFQPKYNILLKDDKSFPYIKIALNHAFPRLTKYRGRDFSDGFFFGPFVSNKFLDITLDEIQKLFKLRPCSDTYFASRKKPCIQYEINRCYAPCVGKISESDYSLLVKQLRNFLFGKNKKLQKILFKQMTLLSNQLKFEEAAIVKNKIQALNSTQFESRFQGVNLLNTDIIAIIEIGDNVSIQVVIYRNNQDCGNKSYILSNIIDNNISDILESFIIQFYQNNIPADEILVNEDITNKILIIDTIKQIHGKFVKIFSISQSKKKKYLIENAVLNAEYKLKEHRHYNKKYSNHLIKIQKIFGLSKIPKRIEIYDNSHIQGHCPVGVMVVADSNGLNKSEYKVFHIKYSSQQEVRGDDYSMLYQVLSRRFSKINDKSLILPDFMIIDGGRGHKSIVNKILVELNLNIDFICMAKQQNRTSGNEVFYNQHGKLFTLDKTLAIKKYLQMLRDEAHNFAINSHRKLRNRVILHSSLDNIHGIGINRKKSLLAHFGSFKSILGASIEELKTVTGISNNLAKKIFFYIHNKD
ncbi:excinuclease ABC subunit UvrC [Rickettsia endosymbiont of Cardiosporidium cionae]|uniref:excinuclease ABC subunit UvrC n=1 Tax=Rickettsia endosymbiont of Cardiosporidium cionae TaxID=2777155 RepID=UPI001893CBE2|nr:excinuclease ABC subunit UvrC [Rickettsia endosymbiont of Cardiosporidium cionae]KAF8818785.1 excinuclease ABC subunit UvrC [Rickettsia endosymbiont of Cardiosporidium cionae]